MKPNQTKAGRKHIHENRRQKTEKQKENSPLDVRPGSEVSLKLSEIDGHGEWVGREG